MGNRIGSKNTESNNDDDKNDGEEDEDDACHRRVDEKNKIRGLSLYENAIDKATHDAVVAFVEESLLRGREGLLRGSTYTPIPPKWDARKQGREMLQYGTYTHSNRVYDHEIEVEDMPEDLTKVAKTLFEIGAFTETTMSESCTVNVYEKGQWLPPHLDNPNFCRPFCTVSLCADEVMIFGKGIVWPEGGMQKEAHVHTSQGEEYRVLCKSRSALVLDEDAADVYEHAVLPVRAERRISLTFRRRDLNEESIKRRTEFTERIRATYRAKRKEIYLKENANKPKEIDPEQERRDIIVRERRERKKERERRKLANKERKKMEVEKLVQREKENATKKIEPKPKTHKECLPVPEGILSPKRKDDVFVNKMPEVEREHVQKVYDVVARQWHGKRYRSWPAIEKFIAKQPSGALVADVGCGNGKNMNDIIKGGGTVIGMDFSEGLIKICAEKEFEVQVADAVMIPYRSQVFDYAINVAVLHHISSEKRRIRMCEETLRIVTIGGVALFCAWAYEQDKGGISGHDFLAQDVMVPFHKRPIEKGIQPNEQKELDDLMVREGKAPSHGEINVEKHTVVYQRYCHVYKEGELEALFKNIKNCKVVSSCFDFGNWYVEVKVTG